MDDLERVLEEIRVEQLRSRKPLTRRFIVTEGLSENFGDIVDLPRVVFSSSILGGNADDRLN